MNDLATQKEKREDTFRRYLQSAKKELEREHTSWQRVNRWMRLAQEECTRLSELDFINKHHEQL
jgi:hypothetical protein